VRRVGEDVLVDARPVGGPDAIRAAAPHEAAPELASEMLQEGAV
jgi:hypothetical protein